MTERMGPGALRRDAAAALAGVPDGWAKVNGQWVQVEALGHTHVDCRCENQKLLAVVEDDEVWINGDPDSLGIRFYLPGGTRGYRLSELLSELGDPPRQWRKTLLGHDRCSCGWKYLGRMCRMLSRGSDHKPERVPTWKP